MRRLPALVGLMVVGNLDFIGIFILPAETYSILLVDSDAVLGTSIGFQPFKPVTRRHRQVEQIPHTINLVQFPPCRIPECSGTSTTRSRSVESVKNVFAALIPKRAYHVQYYNGYHCTCRLQFGNVEHGRVECHGIFRTAR